MPRSLRTVFLTAASLIFYSCFSIKYTVLLMIALAVNAALSVIIDRLRSNSVRKTIMIVGILINVSTLCFYKYFDFLTSFFEKPDGMPEKSLMLPLGISFFTFKAISLLVDTYKRKHSGKPGFAQAALYLSFFGQIVSGPLSRVADFETDRRFNADLFSDGVIKFVIGFSKKILLANVLYGIVTEVYASGSTSAPYLWLGAISFSLYLYYDFSGYSEMAEGISNLFGFKCPKNFDYPYMTGSVSEFWRRWHITLGSWFRDYVYIPMGGSRVAEGRLILNLLTVWLLTGIWHGSTLNFIIWGLLYFVLITAEKLSGFPKAFRKKPAKVLYRLFSLIFINFMWVIFNSESLSKAANYIKGMVLFRSDALSDKRVLVLLRENAVIIIVAVILCFPIVPKLREKLKSRKTAYSVFKVLFYTACAALFVVSVSFIITGQNNPFAYANF
ncbi:MAG: MBOAT family protein [Clostridia bacterium]|nr:MBOAT family protein [Clostridia bacterium]